MRPAGLHLLTTGLLVAASLCACGSQHPAASARESRGAARGGGRPAARGPATPRAPVAVARAAGPAARDLFAVLRRQATPADRMPRRAADSVLRGNAQRVGGGVVLDPRSARRVSLRGVPPIWVLGGGTEICLMTAEPGAGSAGFAYAFGCVPAGLAEQGGLVRTYTEVASRRPRTLVEGVVADGATHVRMDLGGARTAPLAVRDNVYAGEASSPLSVSFRSGGARRTVPLPLAPGSPGVLLGAAGWSG